MLGGPIPVPRVPLGVTPGTESPNFGVPNLKFPPVPPPVPAVAAFLLAAECSFDRPGKKLTELN